MTDTYATSYRAAANASESTPVSERERIRGWLGSIDPALDDATFETLWRSAGAEDAARAARLRASLSRLLPATATGSDGNSEAAVDAALDAFVADAAHRAEVVAIGAHSSTELAALARADAGMRIALAGTDPYALVGNRGLFAQLGDSSYLDRYSPDTGDRLVSESWLDDRAKFTAWLHAAAGQRASAPVDGVQWTFVDRAQHDGDATRFVLGGADDPAARHQVVFGSGHDDVLRGAEGTDRLHGGDGADVLRGRAGADLLDGGTGDDLLLGGAGDDELDGGAGDDELDGGRGDDRLDGGSGDDELAGGLGDDRLAGGRGHDRYLIDAGSGDDVIVDVDGDGEIIWNDATVAGTATATADGSWTLDDGRYTLTLAGDSTDGAQLTLRASGDSTGDATDGTAAATSLRVVGWHDGDLGIHLSPRATSAGVADDGTVSSAQRFDAAAGTGTGSDGAAVEPGEDEAAADVPVVADPGLGSNDATADWEAAYVSFSAGLDTGSAVAAVSLADIAAIATSPPTAEATAIALAVERAADPAGEAGLVATASPANGSAFAAGGDGEALGPGDIAAAIAATTGDGDDAAGSWRVDEWRMSFAVAAAGNLVAPPALEWGAERLPAASGIAQPPTFVR